MIRQPDDCPISDSVLRAEKSVVGSMLRDNDVIADVLNLVKPEYLTLDCREVFVTIVALWEASKPADLVTVHEELHRMGKWHERTANILMDLRDAAPSPASAPHYARIVRDAAVLRNLADVGSQIHHLARTGGDAEAALEEAERAIYGISDLGIEGQTYELRDLVFPALEQFESHRSRGLATGFLDLDELTSGLQPGELAILGARPSVGKTALGLAIANNVRKAGAGVFFASLEQSKEELTQRILCMEASISSHHARGGKLTEQDKDRLADSVEGLCKGRLHIDDMARQSMLRITSTARRLRRRHEIGLVVIDYVQLIEPEDRRAPRYEQVGQCTRKLKALAKDLGIPVLALAQVNRASEERPNSRPRLSDLRESGNVEQDADTVMLLHRNEEQMPGVIVVIVAKQRNGPTGEVTLAFRKESMRFENHASSCGF